MCDFACMCLVYGICLRLLVCGFIGLCVTWLCCEAGCAGFRFVDLLGLMLCLWLLK